MEKLEGSRGCFVCGDPVTENERSLGLEIYWDELNKETFIEIEPENTWCGYENIVHGGIIAAISDDSMAWAVKKNCGQWAVTARMSLTYRKPLKTGQTYSAKGRVLKSRGRKITTSCRIEDTRGEVYTEAEALFILQNQIGGLE